MRSTIGVGRTLLGEDIAGSRMHCRRNTDKAWRCFNFQESSGATIGGRAGQQARSHSSSIRRERGHPRSLGSSRQQKNKIIRKLGFNLISRIQITRLCATRSSFFKSFFPFFRDPDVGRGVGPCRLESLDELAEKVLRNQWNSILELNSKTPRNSCSFAKGLGSSNVR